MTIEEKTPKSLEKDIGLCIGNILLPINTCIFVVVFKRKNSILMLPATWYGYYPLNVQMKPKPVFFTPGGVSGEDPSPAGGGGFGLAASRSPGALLPLIHEKYIDFASISIMYWVLGFANQPIHVCLFV